MNRRANKPCRMSKNTRKNSKDSDLERDDSLNTEKVPDTSDERSWNYSASDPINPTISFFYTPRNITFLVAFFSGLMYCALYVLKENDHIFNTKVGILMCVCLMVCMGLLEFKGGPFIRPHPAFWRAVLALSVVYQMFLMLILFQTKSNARFLFSFVDSSLGVPLREQSYAENCALTIENIKGGLDVFVFAHLAGWIAKTLILRDYWLCWVISVLFEVMEYSLEHQLPNFAECWWDHWILDVLLANGIGIFIGMKICKYLSMKTYSWRGIGEIESVQGKLQRSLKQFTPHSWTSFDWAATKTVEGYATVLLIIAMEILCELNAFYLKFLLWIPVSSNLNVYRLLLMFLLCVPAIREVYQFMNDPLCKRLGMSAWMATVTQLLKVVNNFYRAGNNNQIWAWGVP